MGLGRHLLVVPLRQPLDRSIQSLVVPILERLIRGLTRDSPLQPNDGFLPRLERIGLQVELLLHTKQRVGDGL